jgi:S-DNA-T family DNA segregation ATPase FtsK/SpoIIIE
MFNTKRKSPSVRIPKKAINREAKKLMKKMLKKEKDKEKRKLIKERAKAKAKASVAKKMQPVDMGPVFFDDVLKLEILSGGFFIGALILIALFMSSAPFPQVLFTSLQKTFGLGTWVLPLLLISAGIFTIKIALNKDEDLEFWFPPVRVMALLFLFASVLGLINLLVPHEESLAMAHRYGGAVGFALGFFPREFLGTGVTVIILLALTWVSTVIGFRLRWSDLIHGKVIESESEIHPTKSPRKKSVSVSDTDPASEKKSAPSRFANEIKIIDSTGKKKTKKEKTKTISLEEEMSFKKKSITGHKWDPPTLDLLKESDSTIVVNEKKLREDAEKIRAKLEQFNIHVTMKSVHVGPTVTQFTLEPAAGVKLTKITSLKKDLTLSLAAESLRIEAPIRGKSLVGIEIPNETRAVVSMREIIDSDAWRNSKSNLKLAVGRDVAGKPIIDDLAKMPHLLIAGKTGSGKSVGMNAFLCSLLWNNSPDELKLILIDPKRVELKRYDKLPHLLTPVITEPEKSVSALAWAVAEMNRRYKKLSEHGVVNLGEYNEKFPDAKEPYIVIVIDELADLMMVAGKDVEAAVCRIAQMARAVGMHLMIATQRPSVDVVTGLIKANLPARIAFRVSSGIDSRTIIDGIGAEDLLGMGDMLSLDGNSGRLTRIQGIYITNNEVERLTNHFKLQFPEAMMNDEITKQSIEGMAKGGVLTAGIASHQTTDKDLDDKFEVAVQLVIENNKASASFLQRRLEIGYARAARILDQMEERNIIGPSRGAKAREVYGR